MSVMSEKTRKFLTTSDLPPEVMKWRSLTDERFPKKLADFQLLQVQILIAS